MGIVNATRDLAGRSLQKVAAQSKRAVEACREFKDEVNVIIQGGKPEDAKSAQQVLNDERDAIINARKAKRPGVVPVPPGERPDYIGLAFSGGGIRSATFNLGILQGVAQSKLLPHVDYLSTVSGGGYIGTWLVAWIKRLAEPNAQGDARPGAQTALERVQNLLKPDQPDPNHVDLEAINNLRRNSNYLTPNTSIFNADAWTMLAIWFRNTLLNLTIIVCLIAIVLLLPRFVGWALYDWRGIYRLGPFPVEGWISAVALLVAAVRIRSNLGKVSGRARLEERQSAGETLTDQEKQALAESSTYDQELVQRRILLPATIGCTALAVWIYKEPGYFTENWSSWVTAVLVVGFGFITFRGGFVSGFAARLSDKNKAGTPAWLIAIVVGVFLSAMTGFVTAAMLYGVANAIEAVTMSSKELPWIVATFGTPVVLAISALGLSLEAGLVGQDMPDSAREWLGRLRAWSIIYSGVWAGVFGVALFGPWLLYQMNGWVTAAAGSGWLVTTVLGVLAGNSDSTGNGAKGLTDKGKELIALAAPYVFMAGVFLLVSLGIHELVSDPELTIGTNPPGPSATLAGTPESVTLTVGKSEGTPYTHSEARLNQYARDLAYAAPGDLVGLDNLSDIDLYNFPMLLLTAIFAGGVLAWRVDINEFSMHYFYKNRLARCYLGASRPREKRKPDAFTRFDGGDDFPLARLFPKDQQPSDVYCGPYPIVNAALNITGGTALAWQERQAASYVFTPLYTGFDKEFVDPETNVVDPETNKDSTPKYAFRATEKCGYVGGITAGQAMAISGAAASPNSGYHTSTAVAFFLTVLNARLGWWLGNPAKDKYYSKSSPKIGLPYLLAELFGLANTRRNYVNLSDGGHFDNLGIYELVRRRCQYIIACDGEQDGDMTFGGLAGVIRKCETDFGAKIDINVDQLRLNGDRRSAAHCSVGTIKYATQPGEHTPQVGRLVYLKSSLTGNEDPDLIEYQWRNEQFPHQSTGDQWFDESQFESYRRLGLHVAETAFGAITSLDERSNGAASYPAQKQAFFEDVNLRHYPPSKLIAQAFTRHTEALAGLLHSFGEEKTFKSFDESVFSLWTPITETGKGAVELERSARYWCFAIIQLMENVYVDLELDDPKERNHPDNAGWLLLFRRWSVTPLFRRTWDIVGSAYGARFQRFFERLQIEAGMPITGVWNRAAEGAPLPVETITLTCSTAGPWTLTGSAIVNGGEIEMTNLDYNGGRVTFKLQNVPYRFTLSEKDPGSAFLARSADPQQTAAFALSTGTVAVATTTDGSAEPSPPSTGSLNEAAARSGYTGAETSNPPDTSSSHPRPTPPEG